LSITQRLDKKTIYGWTLTGLAERLMPYRDSRAYKYSTDQWTIPSIGMMERWGVETISLF